MTRDTFARLLGHVDRQCRSRTVALALAAFVGTVSSAPARASVQCAGNDICLQSSTGQIMSNPKVYVVFWGLAGRDPYNDQQNMTNFLTAIGGWKWSGVATQYHGTDNSLSNQLVGFGPNLLQGTWTDTTNAPPPDVPMNDEWNTAMTKEINAGVSHFNILGDPDTILIIATGHRTNPPNVGSCQNHGNTTTSPRNAFIDFRYAADCVAYPESSLSSTPQWAASNLAMLHELQETVTDPFGVSWRDYGGPQPNFPNGGDYYCRNPINPPNGPGPVCEGQQAEIGDKCGLENLPLGDFWGTIYPQDIYGGGLLQMKLLTDNIYPNTFAIAPMWSNAMADRSPQPPWNSSVLGVTSGCAYSHTARKMLFYESGGNVLFYNTDPVGSQVRNLGKPGALQIQSAPAAVSWGPNRFDVFIYASNKHLWHTWSSDGGLTQGAWEDWGAAPAGGAFAQSPSVTSWGPGRLDILATVVIGGGRTLYHKYWNVNADGSNTNSAWESWGTQPYLYSGPAATSIQYNWIDGFALDATSNLLHVYWQGPGSTPTWENWGKPAGATLLYTSNPAVAQWAPWRYDIFVGDTGGNLEHYFWDHGPGGWDPSWGRPPGGAIVSEVAAISPGTNQLRINALAANGQVYERYWFNGDLGWTSQANGAYANGLGAAVW